MNDGQENEGLDEDLDQELLELHRRYERLCKALPMERGPDDEPTQSEIDLFWLHSEALLGIFARHANARKRKRGPKSDLKEQVIVSAADFLLEQNAEWRHAPGQRGGWGWYFNGSLLSKAELLDGTLAELAKYQPGYRDGDAVERSDKRVRNLLSERGTCIDIAALVFDNNPSLFPDGLAFPSFADWQREPT